MRQIIYACGYVSFCWTMALLKRRCAANRSFVWFCLKKNVEIQVYSFCFTKKSTSKMVNYLCYQLKWNSPVSMDGSFSYFWYCFVFFFSFLCLTEKKLVGFKWILYHTFVCLLKKSSRLGARFHPIENENKEQSTILWN